MSKFDFTRSKFAMPQAESAHPIRDLIISDIESAATRREKRAKGMSMVAGGKNACGATLAQYVCGPKRLLPAYKAAYALAQNLINALEQTGKVRRLPASRATDKGVIIVCVDLNGNHLTDHVGLSLGDKRGARLAQPDCYFMVDNQSDVPYQRNISKGRKTPVLYCLEILV